MPSKPIALEHEHIDIAVAIHVGDLDSDDIGCGIEAYRRHDLRERPCAVALMDDDTIRPFSGDDISQAVTSHVADSGGNNDGTRLAWQRDRLTEILGATGNALRLRHMCDRERRQSKHETSETIDQWNSSEPSENTHIPTTDCFNARQVRPYHTSDRANA